MHAVGGEGATRRRFGRRKDRRIELGQNAAAHSQLRRRLVEQTDHERRTISLRVEGLGGLGDHFCRQARAGRHIWEVRADDVERAGQRSQQVPAHQLDPLAERMRRHVARGDLECLLGCVRSNDLHVGRVMREGDRDAAAAGPHVRHPHRVARVTGDLDRALHKHLGVGIRDEDRGGDDEIEPHELLVADQVGHRFAFGSFRREAPIRDQLSLGERAIEPQIEVEAAQPEHVGQQDLRVEAR